MMKDPVCGMDVEPKPSTPKSQYEGKLYFFCCKGCKEEFDQDPKKFVQDASAA